MIVDHLGLHAVVRHETREDTALVESHVWRAPHGIPDGRGQGPRLDRPCEYMNCRRPRSEHAERVEPEPCSRCGDTLAAVGVCCSSHNKNLCHCCYRRTHFVEVCVEGCPKCAAESLPVVLR